MDVRVGLWRKLSTKELMLLNCDVGEDLESPLDCKEIKPVHPKGNQSWIFIGRTDAETETPILWPPDAKNWLIGKDPDAGKDWRQEEKGTTEDEMVGWHHRLNGHEFEWTPVVGDGQGSLVCCNPRGLKESDTTEQLNWTEHILKKRGWVRKRQGPGEEGRRRNKELNTHAGISIPPSMLTCFRGRVKTGKNE